MDEEAVEELVTAINETLNGTNASSHVETDGAHHHHQPYTILFVFGSCGVGAILRMLLRRWANFVSEFKYGSLMKLPYTVFLMLVGMLLSGIAMHAVEVQPFLLSDMDPELFLHIFLPVVIFESAYVIDTHVFWRSIGHVTLLAVPGLLISTILTALLSLLVPEIGGIANFEVRLYIALLFGAIISATDPVAVVALLKDLGNQKYLGTIIEGEALLNDGAAIVVFKIFLEMLKATTPYFQDMTALSTFQLVMQQSLLGPVMGFAFAKVGGLILGYIYNDALAEITMTLSLTYLTYYFGEWAKTSGVLAVVVFGLALDRASITPTVDHFLHRFWEMLAYLANTLIFVIVGIQVTNFMGDISWFDVGYLVLIYIGITIIRAFSIFCFFPVMSRLGIDLNWRHVLVMTWGGLRGAVGLALAIYLNSYADALSPTTEELYMNNNTAEFNITLIGAELTMSERLSIMPPSVTPISDEEVNFRHVFQKILLHTGGIVLLTLLINASTIEAFLGKLGMLEVTTAQQLTMLNAVNRIQQDIKRSVAVLKYDRFLADARWSVVHDMTTITYPYKELPSSGAVAAGGWTAQGKIHPVSEDGTKPEEIKMSKSEDLTFKSLFEEARLRLIKALKMSYWKQYSNGMLTDQEARVLVSAADTAADKPGEFINVDSIRKCWQVKGFLPWFKSKLEDIEYGKKTDNLQPPGRSRQIRRLFRIVRSGRFELFMQMVILINIIPIIQDFMLNETWANSETWWLALQITNYIFIVIYCIEAGMKFVGLGYKQYFADKWNWFDILILALCFIEIIVDLILVDAGSGGSSSLVKTVKTTKVFKFSKFAKTLRMLRATRLLRLSKTIIPKTIDFINKQINKRLSYGYDVGKGFVTAEEEVAKLIVSISENRAIQEKLMAASNHNRLTVIREMGLLQRDHPGIAISVKTRSAVRTILNQTKDTIYQLCAGGVLDETETQLLEKGVEVRLKKQVPSFLPPPPPEDLLESIPWMLGDPNILSFIRAHSTIMDYDYGDIIMQEGDEADGIHIVVYGMIRLYGGLYGQIQLFRLQAPTRSAKTEDDVDVPTGMLRQKNKSDQEDFLCSGNIIGEIGLLTHSKRTCTVSCETAVQTFFIPAEDMFEAFAKFPQLKKAMWQVVGTRISAPLFMDHMHYQGYSVEQIHLHLSRGYIVELTPDEPTFSFSDSVEELSVIHGSVHSPVTGDVTESPCLVLPEQDTLNIHHCDCAVLLVIPRDHGFALDLVGSEARSLIKHHSRIASHARLSGIVGPVPSCDVTTD